MHKHMVTSFSNHILRYCKVAIAREIPDLIKQVPEVMIKYLKDGGGKATCECTMDGLVGSKWAHYFFTTEQIIQAAPSPTSQDS